MIDNLVLGDDKEEVIEREEGSNLGVLTVEEEKEERWGWRW